MTERITTLWMFLCEIMGGSGAPQLWLKQGREDALRQDPQKWNSVRRELYKMRRMLWLACMQATPSCQHACLCASQGLQRTLALTQQLAATLPAPAAAQATALTPTAAACS